MAYKTFREMLRDLNCEELEIEDAKAHKRQDKRGCEIILERMMKEKKVCVEHFNKEVCLNCKLPYGECPHGDVIIKEMKKDFEERK